MRSALPHFLCLLSSIAFAIPTDFRGESILGSKVAVSSSAAPNGTLVLFLSAKCPCSASHESGIIALHREFSMKGFQFLGVHSNADESSELTRAHFSALNLPFPVLEDRDSKLADEFHAYKTPHAFLLDRNGKILFQGGIDDSHLASEAKHHYLRDALLAVSNHQIPDPSEVRALGCVIKRKEKP